jgi:hypothetical protein
LKVRLFSRELVIVFIVFLIVISLGVAGASYFGVLDTPKNTFNAIFGLVNGAGLASFLYLLEVRGESVKRRILQKLELVAYTQDTLHFSRNRMKLYPILGQLQEIIDIVDKSSQNMGSVETMSDDEVLSKYEDIRKINRKELSGKVHDLKDLIKQNEEIILGDLTRDVKTVVDYCDEICEPFYIMPSSTDKKRNELRRYLKNCKHAIDMARITKYNIKFHLRIPALDPEQFKDVKLSAILGGRDDCIVVVGCKPNRDDKYEPSIDDLKTALMLKKSLNDRPKIKLDPQQSGTKIKVDIEMDQDSSKREQSTEKVSLTLEGISKRELQKFNLILIGGPNPNSLTRELNKELLIQYERIGDANGFYSRISDLRYCNDKTNHDMTYATIQALRNPHNKDKFMIVVFGLKGEGTQVAVRKLIDLVSMNGADKSWYKVLKEITVPSLPKGEHIDDILRNSKRPDNYYPARVLQVYSNNPPDFIE